jgi:2-polyprenyl-3-methyl-5-hydroxy-6-metoxy-1,4-benzoquinol methylase
VIETPNECLICGGREFERLHHVNNYWVVRCRACSLVFCDPIPTEDELRQRYAKPELYSEKPYVPHSNFGRRLKYTLLLKILGAFFPRSHRIRLLELGCSQGDLLRASAKSGRYDATGLDYEKGPVEYARSVGLDARQGDLESSGFPANSFDVVAAIHVVEHLHNPLKTFTEIRCVLRPGGLFFAVTPCITHFKARWAGRNWKYLGPPDHLWYFSPKTVTLIGAKIGFATVHASCLYHRAHLRFLLRKC